MSEIIVFFQITIGSCKFMQLLGAFLNRCKFAHLFTLEFLAVLPALSYICHTFVGRFKCIGWRMAFELPKPVSQPHFYLNDWCLAAYSDRPQQLSGDFISFDHYLKCECPYRDLLWEINIIGIANIHLDLYRESSFRIM